MDDKNYIGNISTIIKFISMTIAGWLIAELVAHGINLPIDEVTLSQYIGMVIGFIIAYIDAKHPNSFDWLGNGNLVDLGTILGYPSEEVVLNDDYICPCDSISEDDVDDGC